MSLRAPTTFQEARFQYCNYGYDKSKFTSREDCMTNYNPSPAVYTKPDNSRFIKSRPKPTYPSNILEDKKAIEIAKKEADKFEAELKASNKNRQKNIMYIGGALIIGAALYFYYKKK